MQCPICYEEIIRSCIGSCTHHFCYQCIVRWCKTKNTCPICKETINEIRYDSEFDILNNKIVSKTLNLFDENIKILDFSKYCNLHGGITLANNPDSPGVIVKRIVKDQIADICGFKIFDTILFINNIPCTSHKQTISIIDQHALMRKKVVCIML